MFDPTAYYVTRRPRLLKEFDSYLKYVRPVLVEHFGEHQVNALIQETHSKYENLIPQLPYIGGKQPFTRFVTSTGIWLAVYRTASAYGKSIEEVGGLIFEICQKFMEAYPSFITRFFGGMNFSSFYLNGLRKRAIQSQERKYPEDYVYNFIEGDGKTFDYGVDYVECASCKFLAKQGASELAPYLCPVDILYSEKLGWGLMRTQTLAEGAGRCDFRFKKGGPTRVAVPPEIQALLE